MTARQSARIAAARLAYALCTRATVAAWGACVSLAAFLQRQERTAAEDAEVCDYCEPLDGKEIDIDDNFFDSGDSIAGNNGKSMTADYGDVDAPPLHPNCRCYIRPGVISME